ncbi:MAG: hypothetical protein CFK52_00760 [Chloracidobacterium sp. CP2_5A]|nr:MAG: hypothetical protein CFK52_00760 [Chloracidobacterium sp. CP2_5A]
MRPFRAQRFDLKDLKAASAAATSRPLASMMSLSSSGIRGVRHRLFVRVEAVKVTRGFFNSPIVARFILKLSESSLSRSFH